MRVTACRLRHLAFALGVTCALVGSAPARAAEVHVSPAGRDDAAGTAAAPLRTVAAARQAARKLAGREPVAVVIGAGVYYLPDTLVFGPEDSGTRANPVTYAAAAGGEVGLS